jgi:hypothetical protein
MDTSIKIIESPKAMRQGIPEQTVQSGVDNRMRFSHLGIYLDFLRQVSCRQERMAINLFTYPPSHAALNEEAAQARCVWSC